MKRIILFLLFIGLNIYADEELEDRLKKEPENVYIVHKLAKVYHHNALYKEKGGVKKAENFFKQMHKKFPEDMVILAWYGSLLTIKARDSWFPIAKLYYLRKGIAMLDKAIKNAQDNIIVRMIRANNSLHLPIFTKRLDIAIEDFEYLLKLNKSKKLPNQLLPKVHLGLAKAYKSKGKKDIAKKHLKEVLKLTDKSSSEHKEAISLIDEIKD
jgi:tetratricopeptide (TPR) repeat protein